MVAIDEGATQPLRRRTRQITFASARSTVEHYQSSTERNDVVRENPRIVLDELRHGGHTVE
jgi:hypothetical protein